MSKSKAKNLQYAKDAVRELVETGISYPADSIKDILSDFSSVFEKNFVRLEMSQAGTFVYADDGMMLKVNLQ